MSLKSQLDTLFLIAYLVQDNMTIIRAKQIQENKYLIVMVMDLLDELVLF